MGNDYTQILVFPYFEKNKRRHGRHVIATANTKATAEELLDAVFSLQSLSCQILSLLSFHYILSVLLRVYS
jgi:hypothetical protein